MPAMLILDKSQAIDRMITDSSRVEVPEPFVRRAYRVARFERVDAPVGLPALVLAPRDPEAAAAVTMGELEPAVAAIASPEPARVFAWRMPQSLSWPVFSFAFARQSDN
jgi:hypothetical protein